LAENPAVRRGVGVRTRADLKIGHSQKFGLLAVEIDAERAGAEDHEEKFGETAGLIFGEEADGVAVGSREFH